MVLLNDFFTIVKHEESTGKTTIALNGKHVVYKGHFPGHPVTPAVIQMKLVHELLEFRLAYKVKLVSVSQAKFLKILNPEEFNSLEVEIDFTEKDDEILLNAVGLNQSLVFFKIQAFYTKC